LPQVENCMAGSGAAAILFGDATLEECTPLYGLLLEGCAEPAEGWLPTLGLARAQGLLLLGMLANGSVAATVSVPVEWPANGVMWGTSMATPHVSAVAGLVWSAYPNCTNQEIRQALAASALDLGAPGRDAYYGHGLVQVGRVKGKGGEGGGRGEASRWRCRGRCCWRACDLATCLQHRPPQPPPLGVRVLPLTRPGTSPHPHPPLTGRAGRGWEGIGNGCSLTDLSCLVLLAGTRRREQRLTT
jgi:hypothetical protein